MNNQRRTRSTKGRPRSSPPQADISHLVELGASARRPQYFRYFSAFLWPVLIAIFVQTSIYAAFIARAGRSDWNAAVLVIAALAAVPLFSSLMLFAFRRNRAPITTAVVVVLVFFSFAATLVSALRVFVSYSALLATLPVAILAMSLAYIWFLRSSGDRVSLIAFPRYKDICRQLGDDIQVIDDPAADLSAVDIVLIDPGTHHSAEWSGFLNRCYLSGVEILPWSRFLEIRRGRVHIPSFDLAQLTYGPGQFVYAHSKRFLDILVVVLSLPLTLPLTALVALYLMCIDGFPVLFIQLRRGFRGRRFRIYKFRTMYRDTAGGSTVDGDRRIMPGCKLIRKLRLDELPQLYNILRGDMSLVGPRPVTEEVFRASQQMEPKFALRSLVAPGISGWAQVSMGYASTTEEEIEKLAFDLYYVKHLSFDLDLQIVFKTVRIVLFGTGAK